MKTSKEIKAELIELFKETSPDETYWKHLEELFGLMYKNKPFEDALKLIDQEELPLSVRVKAMHFKNDYNEYCYDIDYMQQMEEEGQFEENY